jgi:hypothetical protein
VKCYHSFESTGDTCNNRRGLQPLKCKTTIQESRSRTDSIELETRTEDLHTTTAAAEVFGKLSKVENYLNK